MQKQTTKIFSALFGYKTLALPSATKLHSSLLLRALSTGSGPKQTRAWDDTYGAAPRHQGEIRLNHNPYKAPEGVEAETDGDYVPEIFRQNRHKYSSKPATIEGYRKQITYRSVHIGTKELEIILGDWLSLNLDKMPYEELEKFDADVLDIENPSLQRYLVNGEPLLEKHSNKYMKVLMEYVEARKVDYANNVPQNPIYG